MGPDVNHAHSNDRNNAFKAALHNRETETVCLCVKFVADPNPEEKPNPVPVTTLGFVWRIQNQLLKCLCASGGDEPREAQLGASERRPPCSHHSGGHTQSGQDQAPAGHQRGQETSCACCEYQSKLPPTLPQHPI